MKIIQEEFVDNQITANLLALEVRKEALEFDAEKYRNVQNKATRIKKEKGYKYSFRKQPGGTYKVWRTA